MKTIEDVESWLNAVHERIHSDESVDATVVQNLLGELKCIAVSVGDEDQAKLIWCYEQIFRVQETYLTAFDNLKSGKFYDAWCLFERVEISLHHLAKHFDLKTDRFQLNLVRHHTNQFQSLYPYKYFMSPGYLILETRCSVCNKKRSIRSSCGHELGEIYGGEACSRIVTKAKFLEISLVTEPVQKYSVPFLKDEETGESVDHYDYTLVEYVSKGLSDPFDRWKSQWTTRLHPHSLYSEVTKDDDCPCESRKTYGDCCLSKPGVLRPHLEVLFSNAPPSNLPSFVYTR